LTTWKERTTWKKKKKSETKPQACQSMGNKTESESEREREEQEQEQEQEQERLEIGRRKWIGMENHITRECNSNKSNTPKTKKIGERAWERASARERRGETRKEKKTKKRARGRGKRCFRKKPQRESACQRSQCCGVLRVACEIAQVRDMAC
jgi:hypothetical protein